jgi:antiphage defense system Thoeris ThsB-like protein
LNGVDPAVKVFFGYDYLDVSRALFIRNCARIAEVEATGFIPAAEYASLVRSGDEAVRGWIDRELGESEATVLLIGATGFRCNRIAYEFRQSLRKGNPILCIDISDMPDRHGLTRARSDPMPDLYACHSWKREAGLDKLPQWLDELAKRRTVRALEPQRG